MFANTVKSVNVSNTIDKAGVSVSGLNKAGPCDTAAKIKANAACRAR